MKESRQHPYNVTLRVPVDFREWLKSQAEKNRRSINAEMLICLEEARRMRQTAGDHAR